MLLSPFEVRFSQHRIHPEFQDGHMLDETIAEIETIPLADAFLDGTWEDRSDDNTERNRLGTEGDVLFLKSPFACIEVTRWRCKLRDASGLPKMDPVSGMQLYSEEVHWFSLDNRRLRCLQQAAAAAWPNRVRCEVFEVALELTRCRELRKFDTRTFGHQVAIGRRESPDVWTWCWRTSVGLPVEDQFETGVARQQSLRWRGTRHRGGRNLKRNFGAETCNKNTNADLFRRIALFLLVYLSLRVLMWAMQQETANRWFAACFAFLFNRSG